MFDLQNENGHPLFGYGRTTHVDMQMKGIKYVSKFGFFCSKMAKAFKMLDHEIIEDQ